MKTLKFMGHSDDTFGDYGTTMDDIDNCGSCEPIQCVIEADGTALIVTGQYNRNGTAPGISVSAYRTKISLILTGICVSASRDIPQFLR